MPARTIAAAAWLAALPLAAPAQTWSSLPRGAGPVAAWMDENCRADMAPPRREDFARAEDYRFALEILKRCGTAAPGVALDDDRETQGAPAPRTKPNAATTATPD